MAELRRAVVQPAETFLDRTQVLEITREIYFLAYSDGRAKARATKYLVVCVSNSLRFKLYFEQMQQCFVLCSLKFEHTLFF